jgi:hypothetical protein
MKFLIKLIFTQILFNLYTCYYYHYSNEKTSLYFFENYILINRPFAGCPTEHYYKIYDEDNEKYCRIDYSTVRENSKLYRIKILHGSLTQFHFDLHSDNQAGLKALELPFDLDYYQQLEIFGLIKMIQRKVESITYNLAYTKKIRVQPDDSTDSELDNEETGYDLFITSEGISYKPINGFLSDQVKSKFEPLSNDSMKKSFRRSFINLPSLSRFNSLNGSKPKLLETSQPKTEESSQLVQLSRSRSVHFDDETKVPESPAASFESNLNTRYIRDIKKSIIITIQEKKDNIYDFRMKSKVKDKPVLEYTAHFGNFARMFFVSYCEVLPEISCSSSHCKLPEDWVKNFKIKRKKLPVLEPKIYM